MKYKHIIWDWNGTLLDDAWLCVEVMNGVLSRRNMARLSPRKYMEFFEFPVKKYYQKLGFNFAVEPFEKSGTEFITEYNKRYREPVLQKNSLYAIKAIRKLRIGQSILSAQEQNTLNDLIQIHNLKVYFDQIIGLNNHYAHSKTKNGIHLMRKLNFGPHEVLFVGDTIHDFEVAESIAADCILVPSGHQSLERLHQTGTKVVESLSEVVNYIQKSI